MLPMTNTNNTKTVIESITLFNMNGDSQCPPSKLLQQIISKESLFKIDSEEVLINELQELGFLPQKVDVQLGNKYTDELESFKEVLMVEDPCVGSVLLYLNIDVSSIH